MKLNVGCGTDSFGDVRVDIQRYRVELPHKPKTTVNVIASAEALPFPNKVFDETRCWHVLEHLTDPMQALKEFKRVSNQFVVIKVPHANFYRGQEHEQHIFSWNRYTLRSLLQKLFRNVDIKTTWRMENLPTNRKNLVERKLFTLKLMIFSLFWGRNELTAVCNCQKKP